MNHTTTIVIPPPRPETGKFGFAAARGDLVRRLADTNMPLALLRRITQLPEEQWLAAANQEGYVP